MLAQASMIKSLQHLLFQDAWSPMHEVYQPCRPNTAELVYSVWYGRRQQATTANASRSNYSSFSKSLIDSVHVQYFNGKGSHYGTLYVHVQKERWTYEQSQSVI